MAANSEIFPWPSHYGHFRFFESRMRTHGNVASLTAKGNGTYELIKDTGQTIRVFICECYSFGVAEFLEVSDKIGNVDAVIIDSMWCGYTHDAKAHCRELRVGLFKVGEFMGALGQADFWNYIAPGEREKGRSS
jgi:hypothetical protein